MLARFCAGKMNNANNPTQSPANRGLGSHLIQECARKCVYAARRIIALVSDTEDTQATASSSSMGLLPWWYRVYYLHIAGTVLLAAILGGPDLLLDYDLRPWGGLTSALRRHEHLSAYVRQCRESFEILSTKIVEAQEQNDPSMAEEQEEVSSLFGDAAFAHFLNDMFPGPGCDLDNFDGL